MHFCFCFQLAFVVAIFDSSSSEPTGDGVTYTGWGRPDAVPQYLEFANAVEPVVVGYYGELFDFPYPLPKMDQVREGILKWFMQ